MPEDIDLARPCTLCLKCERCVCRLHRDLTPSVPANVVLGEE